MQRLAEWIVSHRKHIIAVTAILIALSIVGTLFVKKNGDVISYLDPDTETMIAKQLLQDKYDIVGDCTIAISYLPEHRIREIVAAIERADRAEYDEYYRNRSGKKRVRVLSKCVWVGTFDDLDKLPQLDNSIRPSDVEKIQSAAREKFVLEQTVNDVPITTYTVCLYLTLPGSDDRTIRYLDLLEAELQACIRSAVRDGDTVHAPQDATERDFYYVGGTAQNARALLQSSIGDMPKFFAVAVAAVFLILLLTSRSFFEPLIFLATLGVSMLFNMGSNIIAGTPVGTISSITSSCAMILQLAIAMDYSIFLMHAYYEESARALCPRDAMIRALPKTISAVSASALTTIGGFVALFFMQYGMGYDLGFVLAKGVLLSLLSVVFLQPILILTCRKAVDRTRHRTRIEVRLKPLAKTVTKPWVSAIILAVCVGLAIPCAYYQTKVSLNYITMTAENPNPTYPESIAQAYGNQLILLVPFENTPEQIASHRAFVEDLYRIGAQRESDDADPTYSEVTDVFSLLSVLDDDVYGKIENSPYRALIYRRLHDSFISDANKADAEHYMLYTVRLQGNAEDPQSMRTLEAVRALATNRFGAVNITGLAAGAYELSAVTPHDFAVVNIVSAVLIFAILLVTFRKPLLSALLLLVIETGIFVNLTIVYWMQAQINFMAYLIVSAILLGATVDYAILVTSKYLDEKRSGATGKAAILNAIYRSAPSVLTSGAILITVSASVFAVTSNLIVAQITELIARGAAISLLLVFTLLPAILTLRETCAHAYAVRRKRVADQSGNAAVLYDADDLAFAARNPSKAERVLRKFGIRKDPIAPEDVSTPPEDDSDTPMSTPNDASNDANTCKNSDVEPTP